MNIQKSRGRGFTLIELLIVIAIIGSLSAIVIASLSTARNKANDASVKANLHTVKTQATVFFGENVNSYGTFDNGAGGPADCPTPGTVDTSVFGNSTIENAIASAIAYTPVGGVASCFALDNDYTATVSRPAVSGASAPPSVYWCVDSAGTSCGVDTVPSGGDCGTCVTTD